jgi:hypothetical protein
MTGGTVRLLVAYGVHEATSRRAISITSATRALRLNASGS